MMLGESWLYHLSDAGVLPFAYLFGGASVCDKFPHFYGDGGPLSSSVLVDEVENDLVLLHYGGNTSAVHVLRSVILCL